MLPEPLRRAIFWASDIVWGPWTLALLLGAGLFLTLRYRFAQVRLFPEAARTLVPTQQAGAEGALSPFQAFMTALGASIGTGNIAGVATAVVSGGPGAVFWIWCYGFFATVIKLTEAVLGIRYRSIREGHVSAGPMHYLRDGLRSPTLAWLYALVAGIAALTTTPFTQPNSMAVVLESQFHLPTWVSGIGIAVLAWLVIIGGVRSIGRVAEKLAPLKVGLYLAGGLWVILFHAGKVPEVFALIFREAFSLEAAKGGTAGIGLMVAMRYGLARGIYANEAGYGTAAVAYGSARSEQPLQQGLNAVMEVFIVSFVTSSISALTILVSGVWQSGRTSTALVASAFDTAIPVGGWVVAFCAFLFGYTTLIGWAYYGEQFLEYIAGVKIARPYRWVYCGLIYFGAVGKPETVWAWGDLMNGLQIFPNLVGLIGLSGVVLPILREREKSQSVDPGGTGSSRSDPSVP
ncbi:MAG: alanine/glycine:cation symporter family protein [Hyalangium sp.]|uniref:alanine/glycine:cation symporter family protein n=1 Tax=Hyalangium sp. TaxID=2028555 RepID=UPI00389AE6C7